MSATTMTSAPLTVTLTTIPQMSCQPHPLARLTATTAAPCRAVVSFLNGVVRGPVLPIGALLEASILASLLESHSDRDPGSATSKELFDLSPWRGL
jgi:predicted membrane protein